MLMRTSMRARLDFPPHDHPMLPGKNAALNFVIDTLPRQLLKRAEPRHHGHDCFPSVALPPEHYSGSRLSRGRRSHFGLTLFPFVRGISWNGIFGKDMTN